MFAWEKVKVENFLIIGTKCIRLIWMSTSRCIMSLSTTLLKWRRKPVVAHKVRKSTSFLRLRRKISQFKNTRNNSYKSRKWSSNSREMFRTKNRKETELSVTTRKHSKNMRLLLLNWGNLNSLNSRIDLKQTGKSFLTLNIPSTKLMRTARQSRKDWLRV